MATGSLVAWIDDESRRMGLSSSTESLVFEKTAETRLVLLRLEPARGPGGSQLYVEEAPSRNPAREYETRTMILEGTTPQSLEETVQRLSRLWKTDVIRDVGLDD